MTPLEAAQALPTYRTFRPSAFDRPGLGLRDRQDWRVLPVLLTRDSDLVETSNWAVVCAWLERYRETSFEVHRFGHWACGWFEIILVNPRRARVLQLAGEIAMHLEDYPLLSDSHYSELGLEWHDEGRCDENCYFCDAEREDDGY